MSKQFNYRLGFDLGYTSIGWACILLDEYNQPFKVHDFGVRIFPSGRDDKSKKPTSVKRRETRGAARNRDRYKVRRESLLNYMIEIGLQPRTVEERKQLATQEPLQFRAKGITEQLELHELGRALFHINQHRGFKSNRIADRSQQQNDEKSQGLKKGIYELQKTLIENNQTLGQYLYCRLQNNLNTRLKADNKNEERWTSRKMYEDEFWLLINKQQEFYPNLITNEIKNKLHHIIFFQYPLQPQKPGFCTLIDGEVRARLAYPQTQVFRILQEINNLEIIESEENITFEMRQALFKYLTQDFSELDKQGFLTWNKIRKIIGIKGCKFNLDCQGRKGLRADLTTRNMQSNTIVATWWDSISLKKQRDIIDIIQTAQSNEDLKEKLDKAHISYNSEILDYLYNVSLDDGYGRVSIVAMEKLEPHLRNGFLYSEACEKEGINHSDDYDGTIYPEGNLPYYGEVLQKHVIGGTYDPMDKNNPEKYFGKINNPTVHMGLNQLRLILNELVKEYGCPPREVYLEMARETSLSAKRLGELNAEQINNRKKNEKIDAELDKLGISKNYANRMKYKLWEDLAPNIVERCCPLSGKMINLDNLFSPQIEIEHIIPFSRSFDDSRNNKMLCYKSANQVKGNRTPYEAFGHTSDWPDILARASKMASDHKNKKEKNFLVNKYWRFLPDAIEKMGIEESNFLARQLNDTKYMSRIASRYVEFVTGKYPNERRVFAIKGKFTSDLRHHWGLDRLIGNIQNGKFTKDRTNHHHHAIDAITIALSSSSMIQKLAKANKTAKAQLSDKMYLDIQLPFKDFRVDEIEQRLKSLIISHKLDQKAPKTAIKTGGSIGQLHEDTNFGHITDNIYATRKPLTADNFPAQKNINEIASNRVREDISNIFSTFADDKGKLKSSNKKAYEEALNMYKQQNTIKKVRVHLVKENLIPIKDKQGKAYRYVVGGNNFAAEIWVTDKGKKAGKWQCEIIRNFDVNQKGFMPKWRKENPTAMKVMRLQINDMVAINKDNQRIICRVQKMDQGGRVVLRQHNDAETDSKTQISTSASSLQKYNARKIFVSPIGKIYDPGKAKQRKCKIK